MTTKGLRHDVTDVETITMTGFDARGLLVRWANDADEWVRSVVRRVLNDGRPLTDSDVDAVYELFRQEKALDTRTLPREPPLAIGASPAEADEVLRITSLSEVTGVNALLPGAVIDPHDGLTILYGENGTGKTGYSRLFKALAASRTADPILGDLSKSTVDSRTAMVSYTLGDAEHTFRWSGEVGVSPFTRHSHCSTTSAQRSMLFRCASTRIFRPLRREPRLCWRGFHGMPLSTP